MRDYLARATAYIQENGDELERARLVGLLGRTRSEPKAARALLTRQNEDGGFPYQMIPGRPSAISATATAMQWMQDLRLLPSSYVERATTYLLLMQRPEGTWEESPALIKFDPPPLIRPGSELARTYCTALGLFWMARLVSPRHDAVRRAAEYLRGQWNGGWGQERPVQVLALAVASLAMVEGFAAPAVAEGLTILAQLPPEAWTADRLADTLLLFYTAAFYADEPLVAWVVRRLLDTQRPDGGWPSEYGPDRDVEVSLWALGALLAFGVSTT